MQCANLPTRSLALALDWVHFLDLILDAQEVAGEKHVPEIQIRIQSDGWTKLCQRGCRSSITCRRATA